MEAAKTGALWSASEVEAIIDAAGSPVRSGGEEAEDKGNTKV